jgi:hypothetical protein
MASTKRSALAAGFTWIQRPSINITLRILFSMQASSSKPQAPSFKPQATSVKHQAIQATSSKHQAPSNKHQAPSREQQAPRFYSPHKDTRG